MFPSNNHWPQLLDRRKDERHAFRSRIYCQVIDPLSEKASIAGPWNLSNGGVCVLVGSQYRPGTHLEMEFRGSGRSDSLNVFAEVVHTVQVPSFEEMWLTGCSFLDEPSEERVLNFCI